MLIRPQGGSRGKTHEEKFANVRKAKAREGGGRGIREY
jgi:hypothetical protein